MQIMKRKRYERQTGAQELDQRVQHPLRSSGSADWGLLQSFGKVIMKTSREQAWKQTQAEEIMQQGSIFHCVANETPDSSKHLMLTPILRRKNHEEANLSGLQHLMGLHRPEVYWVQ